MERLTVSDKQIGEHTTQRTVIDGAAVRERAMEIYWRLKAYEDTGLEPEICAEYKKFEDEIVASGETFNHLIELLRAEKEGRLAVRPGADTSSVVPCRSCEYSCTAGAWAYPTESGGAAGGVGEGGLYANLPGHAGQRRRHCIDAELDGKSRRKHRTILSNVHGQEAD